MNVIEIHGTRFQIGDDLKWRVHGGSAQAVTLVRALDSLTRLMEPELGPHSAPTPAGHVAFEVAKKMRGKVVSLDENESDSNPSVVH